jgi:hypothetical protein
MGAWATAITQGLGRTGNDIAEGKSLNEQQRLAKQKSDLEMIQSKLALDEIKQKLQRGSAPEFVGSYTNPNSEIQNQMRDPLTGKITTVPGGHAQAKEQFKPFVAADGSVSAFNSTTGEMKEVTVDGKPIKGKQTGKNGVMTVDGVPIGVYRNGQAITPDDPEFSPADAQLLTKALGGYQEGEKNKNERIKLAAASRIDSYLQGRMYGVLDSETGNLVEVTGADIRQNPGKYAPASQSVQAKNRSAIFDEIAYTTNMLKDSIEKLPNSAFDPAARAQIAVVLRDERPRAAWYNFLNSNVASSLTPEQIDYVTSLISMQESAMSLRSIAGMGQGSDTLRAAITKMLPGSGTPSKAYAQRQMQLFNGEVQALKKSVPGIGETGGEKPKSGTVNFTEGNKSWDIPANLVDEFKKAHPNATK